jgi:hypothetical protein
MKQIFTLLLIAVLFNLKATAQFSENFDGGTSALSSNCWQFQSAWAVTANAISGSSIATGSTGLSSITTPFLNLTNSSTVSFNYKFDNSLNGNATRMIEIGTVDVNGTVSIINSATLNFNRNNSPTGTQTFPSTPIALTGVRRLIIRVSGSTGDGNNNILIDNLTMQNTNLNYAPNSCNSAPIAAADNYFSATLAPFSGDVITNDSEPDGEVMTASVVAQPAASVGSLSFNNNGSFTFTPAPGFTGGPVTFTYRLSDNGYTPLSSNTVTVTINYPELAVLPIQLKSFSGSVVSSKAQLKWSVAENESGNHFEVEKSTDGKSFSNIGVVFTSRSEGSENYTYTEGTELVGEAFYRLKIVDKDKSASYSKILVLKTAKDNKTSSLTLLQNPVVSSLSFTYTAVKPGISMINIYNMSGVKMHGTSMNVQAGFNSFSLTVGHQLSAGTYVLEVVNGLERNVTKIIKN